jgi:hypothetical protein
VTSGAHLTGTLATGLGIPAANLGTPSAINLANASNFPLATNAVKGISEGDGSTITCTAGVCTATSAGLTVGTTTITSGTNGYSEINNNGVLGEEPSITALTCTSQFFSALSSAGAFTCSGLTAAEIPAVSLATGSSTGNTLSAPAGFFVCTATCTVTPPVPAAGYQFCVMDDVATSGTITIGGNTGVFYGTAVAAGTAVSYGSSGGHMTSGGAAGDKVCIVGRDATHYNVGSFAGTWTNS